jgi:hypothetical protein
MTPEPLTLAAAEQARNVAVQMMVERGRGLVLVGAARLDLALEHLLKAVMAPLLRSQPELTAPEQAFILLVTMLVASIEACALLQQPFSPRATVHFRLRFPLVEPVVPVVGVGEHPRQRCGIHRAGARSVQRS